MAQHPEEARNTVQIATFLLLIMSLVFSGTSSLPSFLKLLMDSNASLNKAQEEGRKFWLTSCCHVLCSKHDRKLLVPRTKVFKLIWVDETGRCTSCGKTGISVNVIDKQVCLQEGDGAEGRCQSKCELLSKKEITY
jgi:hypothetical protein